MTYKQDLYKQMFISSLRRFKVRKEKQLAQILQKIYYSNLKRFFTLNSKS